jgi:mannose-6-phosphate isomerase-like protein (cupin superfamily)
MMVNEYKLSSMNQYSPTEVMKHDVTSGECFKSFLLNLLPGQEVPAHTHLHKCVLLFPQTGSGTLFTEDKEELVIESGSIYTDHIGCNFGLRNTGNAPLQVLVILVSAPAD